MMNDYLGTAGKTEKFELSLLASTLIFPAWLLDSWLSISWKNGDIGSLTKFSPMRGVRGSVLVSL